MSYRDPFKIMMYVSEKNLQIMNELRERKDGDITWRILQGKNEALYHEGFEKYNPVGYEFTKLNDGMYRVTIAGSSKYIDLPDVMKACVMFSNKFVFLYECDSTDIGEIFAVNMMPKEFHLTDNVYLKNTRLHFDGESIGYGMEIENGKRFYGTCNLGEYNYTDPVTVQCLTFKNMIDLYHATNCHFRLALAMADLKEILLGNN